MDKKFLSTSIIDDKLGLDNRLFVTKDGNVVGINIELPNGNLLKLGINKEFGMFGCSNVSLSIEIEGKENAKNTSE